MTDIVDYSEVVIRRYSCMPASMLHEFDTFDSIRLTSRSHFLAEDRLFKNFTIHARQGMPVCGRNSENTVSTEHTNMDEHSQLPIM